MTTSRTLRIGAVVLAQLLLVVVAVWAPLSARISGEEVLLRVEPVDPYDPFRGAYVDLGYPDLPGQPVTEADGDSEEPQAEREVRGTAFVPLVEKGGVWVGQPVQRTRPANGTYLACEHSSSRLQCGIESWFVPQNDARALEAAVRDGDALARVKVDGRGHAALVSVSATG